MRAFLSWRAGWLATAATTLGLLAASCGGNKTEADPNVLMQNDFEHLDGWLGQTPSQALTRERAHSGSYSTKVDPTTEYGLTYASTLGKMSDARFTKLKVEAWVYVVPGTEAGASLVTHIGDAPPATKPLLWDGFDVVAAAQKQGEWVHVSKELTMPAEANVTTNYGVFLWRTKPNSTVFLDDLVLTKE